MSPLNQSSQSSSLANTGMMNETSLKQLTTLHYTVAWFCALPIPELLAAKKMLDNPHRTPAVDILEDQNAYTCGDINGHNVVITCLPLGDIGNLSAATVVENLTRSFKNIKFALLVGIGGGVPRTPHLKDPSKDIHLGDVVVGWTSHEAEAVVKWDKGKRLADGRYQIISRLPPPSRYIGNALSKLLAKHACGETNFPQHLARCNSEVFSPPSTSEDTLYPSDYIHPSGEPDCSKCDPRLGVPRLPRLKNTFEFHFGTIATGDTVMKDGALRDQVSHDCYDAMCFDMEAAGILNRQNCLVIRGISDYADTHKNDQWQPYAAATAAAFTREYLYTIDPGILGGIPESVETNRVNERNSTLQLSQNAILLPDIFTSDLIKIGQLVVNPLVPNFNNYTPPADLVKDLEIMRPEPVTAYRRLIGVDANGKFIVSLAKSHTIGFGTRKPSNTLEVNAEQLLYQTFQNATEALRKICESEEAKKWIADLALGGKPFYFVFGLLWLQHAEFKRAIASESNRYTTAPLDENSQLPHHLRMQISRFKTESLECRINGVFGIELMKAKWGWFRRTGNPTWDDKVHWKWPHRAYKGGALEDREFVLDLEHVDINDLNALMSNEIDTVDPDDE
ncbi:hypothetical protein TWF694_003830 [Orbilia ellipsospora]|uniref:Nucleoside phosphorylase domain-containing protein n=1 Tax=Orbilia ellipsospora TaxID=2528407 RepID=A0AAV9X0L2_9PEZI